MSKKDTIKDIVREAMFNPYGDLIHVDVHDDATSKVATVTVTSVNGRIVINDPNAKNIGVMLHKQSWELGSFTTDRKDNLKFTIWEQNR
jgi:hypothetical protein